VSVLRRQEAGRWRKDVTLFPSVKKNLTSDYIKRHCLGWRPALFDELATESCTAHVRFWG